MGPYMGVQTHRGIGAHRVFRCTQGEGSMLECVGESGEQGQYPKVDKSMKNMDLIQSYPYNSDVKYSKEISYLRAAIFVQKVFELSIYVS